MGVFRQFTANARCRCAKRYLRVFFFVSILRSVVAVISRRNGHVGRTVSGRQRTRKRYGHCAGRISVGSADRSTLWRHHVRVRGQNRTVSDTLGSGAGRWTYGSLNIKCKTGKTHLKKKKKKKLLSKDDLAFVGC